MERGGFAFYIILNFLPPSLSVNIMILDFLLSETLAGERAGCSLLPRGVAKNERAEGNKLVNPLG